MLVNVWFLKVCRVLRHQKLAGEMAQQLKHLLLSERAKLSSQHPNSGLQPSGTPVPGYSVPFPALCGHQAHT